MVTVVPGATSVHHGVKKWTTQHRKHTGRAWQPVGAAPTAINGVCHTMALWSLTATEAAIQKPIIHSSNDLERFAFVKTGQQYKPRVARMSYRTGSSLRPSHCAPGLVNPMAASLSNP